MAAVIETKAKVGYRMVCDRPEWFDANIRELTSRVYVGDAVSVLENMEKTVRDYKITFSEKADGGLPSYLSLYHYQRTRTGCPSYASVPDLKIGNEDEDEDSEIQNMLYFYGFIDGHILDCALFVEKVQIVYT